MIRTLLKLLPDDHRTTLGGYVALAVLGVMLRAAGAVLLLPLLSALFGEAPATAWPWVGALAGVTALGFLVDWIVSGLGFRIGFSLLEQGQRRLSRALLDVRLDWFDAERSATARQAIAATGPDLVGLVAYLFTPLLGALLLPVGIGLFLLPLSWPLGVAALAGCPLLLGAWWGSRRLSVGADRRHAAATGTLTERVLEFARAQEALRAARRVQPARSQVGAALAAEHGATRRLLFMQIPGQLLFSFASQTALILLAGTAVLLGLRGELDAPAAVALLVVIARYLEAFATLGELSGAIGSAATMVGKVRAVLEAPRLSEGSREWRPEAAPRIELQGIRSGHTKEDRRVLEGLDLTLEAGTTTAIVGPSGAGKSTLLGLLAGLHVPEAGSLRVDGVDVTELTATSRRELTSAVFQHPYLFEGTLLENVRVGAPGAAEGAVTEALRLARVEEIVARLPDGGAHRVGEAGSALSGGERQRVTIARALLKPAPILLVDEATSALDTENEQAISRALSADPIPRTRVIVAHRLSSIRHADRVIFLEDGQIVEDGSVEALLAKQGRFADFWRQQEVAATWRMGAATEVG